MPIREGICLTLSQKKRYTGYFKAIYSNMIYRTILLRFRLPVLGPGKILLRIHWPMYLVLMKYLVRE